VSGSQSEVKQSKPFDVSKVEVFAAWEQVLGNQGAAGVGQVDLLRPSGCLRMHSAAKTLEGALAAHSHTASTLTDPATTAAAHNASRLEREYQRPHRPRGSGTHER
jgi:hypothetical protein